MQSKRLIAIALTVGGVTFATTLPRLLRQEMPTPTAQHKELLSGVGVWEGTMTNFMPGMEPTPIPARETVTAVGDFWTQVHFECEFLGMPYVGIGFTGYDPAKGKYVGTWIDNMSSHLAVMEGEKDPATGKLVMRWQGPDPMGQMTAHRYELEHKGDSYSSTFFMGAGEGMKNMTIAMKRKGGKAAEAGAK